MRLLEVLRALEYEPGGMCGMCAAWRVPDDSHVPPYGTVSDGTGHNPDCDVAAAVATVEKLEALADEWDIDQSEYPASGVGEHAAAAVRLCTRDLRALLNGDAS